MENEKKILSAIDKHNAEMSFVDIRRITKIGLRDLKETMDSLLRDEYIVDLKNNRTYVNLSGRYFITTRGRIYLDEQL